MSIVEESFRELYPGRPFPYSAVVKYSSKFSDFNANIRRSGNRITVGLSRKWKGVSREIVVGLVQNLLLRLFKDRGKTLNIDLYNNFVRSIHISVPKSEIEPVLRASFDRVNSRYFYGSAELANLIWGNFSRRKLASYNYHTDTISVSRIFEAARPEIIDYLIFHELLHKQLKFSAAGSKTLHHSKAFRELERSFEGHDELEKELNRLARRPRPRLSLDFFRDKKFI